MDLIENTIGRFWKRKDQPVVTPTLPIERKSTDRVWTYEHFREYLLALGRGNEFLLPINQYPDIINLSEEWHSTIEDARKKTAETGYEHFFNVGTKHEARTVHLPTNPRVGNQGSIPSDVQSGLLSDYVRIGVNSIPGDIHSHPSSDHAEFSLGDLYRLLYPNSKNLFIGVVEGNENLFAFRTKGSRNTGLDSTVLNQGTFAKYWYEQNGWEFKGYNPKTGAEMARPNNRDVTSVWQLNLKVARRHNLVLYSGDAKTELVKVFPTTKI